MKATSLAVPFVLLFGCKSPVELYCETHADCAKWGLDFCDVDGEYPASNGAGRTCIENPLGPGTADGGSDSDSDASTGCAEHSDCASQVCDRGNAACVNASQVVYVDGQSGADDVGCGVSGSPCRSMSFGLLQVVGDREFLHVQPGTYVDGPVIVDGRRVHIIADDVELFPAGDQSAIEIRGASIAVVEGLTTEGFLIRCAGDSLLNLRGVTVSNVAMSAFGILINNCPAVIEDSIVRNIAGVGIDGNGITVRRSMVMDTRIGLSVSGETLIEQTSIRDNDLGGVEYYTGSPSGQLVFRNNVVLNNGFGVGISASEAGAVVEHNTITGNTGTPFSCSASGDGTVGARGNIIYGNHAEEAVSIGTGCSITHSNVEGGAPGIGNIDVDPKFVLGDHHLEPSSPCVDRVDTDVPVDIDGHMRPQGWKSDMGADEVLSSSSRHGTGHRTPVPEPQ